MIKLIEFSKNQISRICRLLANFFFCDYSNFRCLESYQLCTLQYCGTKSKTAVYILHYSSTTGAPEGKKQYLNKNHRHSTRKTHPRAKKQVILRLVPLFIWKSLTINYSDNFDRMASHSALAIRAAYVRSGCENVSTATTLFDLLYCKFGITLNSQNLSIFPFDTAAHHATPAAGG